MLKIKQKSTKKKRAVKLVERKRPASLPKKKAQPQVAQIREIRPHPGPQERFLSSDADIVFYGGAAGGGKTFAELVEPLRHIKTRGFSSVTFRRVSPEITNPGGLWDEASEIYPKFGGVPRKMDKEFIFPKSGAKIKFAHLQYESDKYSWQGSQIPLICFDELTHFSMTQFFYLLSRNRSNCGVKPYMRATCNPDVDSWVRKFIEWWIDEKTGYPIPERDGVVRWFARKAGKIIWADDPRVLRKKGMKPKSFTFISANIYDNPTLLKNNPDYEANLQALLPHERARLLGGNWNARATSGDFFNRENFEIVDAIPAGDGKRSAIYWDRAATPESERNPDPDWTVGLSGEIVDGILYITNMVRKRLEPIGVEKLIYNSATQNLSATTVLEEDPGQAGKAEISYLLRKLAGYAVATVRPLEAKQTRAVPVSSQSAVGNVKVLRGKWNDDFFDELEGFPEINHDDIVDALSGLYNYLTNRARPGIRVL